jgi:hypothetical protein
MHAWFQAYANFDVLLNGVVVTTPVNGIKVSGNFSFLDTVSVEVNAGDTLELRIGGRNFDSNSILNGTLTLTNFIGPEASSEPPRLNLVRNGTGGYDLSWASKDGKVYDLVSSTDLAAPILSWPAYDDGVNPIYENILASGTGTNMLENVASADTLRFFALVEKDPLPLFSEDFEAGDGGFTLKVAGGDFTPAGSSWAHGDPDSTGDGGTVTTGNGDSTNCWGTNIGNQGLYANPTETCLRSTVIDLTGVTGAQLTFAEALDLEAGDTAVVNIINAATDSVIAPAIYTAVDGNISNANWTDVPAIDLAAGVGQLVRIEWCFSGQAPNVDYMGWYIDDVVVTETTP